MALGVTGQRQKNKAGVVAPLPLPIVSHYDILHPESTLNNADISGKRAGAMVAVIDGENKGIYIATGERAEDHWVIIEGVTENDVGKETVRELPDMVDVEFDGFDTDLVLTEQRIDTKVIETPMLLLDGSYGFRCRMTFNFSFKKKEESVQKDQFVFAIKLINATGDNESYYQVDHASFTGWNVGGAIIGHVDVTTATTNNIPVIIRTTDGASNFYTCSFSLEWTSADPIAEG